MKKALQKIATFALIVVGFLLTVFLILVTLGAFDFAAYIDGNRVVHSLVIVLAIIYAVLGIYLVIDMFAVNGGLTTMVLYSDNMSAVSTTSRVVRRLVRKAAKSLEGVKIKKLIITQDDKPGFKMGVQIKINGGDVTSTTEKLKFLIETACKDVLGVTFNSIHIKVVKLENAYQPDVEGAEKYAEQAAKQQVCKEACELVNEQISNEVVSTEQAAEVLKDSAEEVERLSEIDTLEQAELETKDGDDAPDTMDDSVLSKDGESESADEREAETV